MTAVGPLTEPKRIAFTGDWHENGDYAARAIKHAADQGADVLIQLGDFGYSYSRRFLADVSAASLFLKAPVLFVDGNHENFDRLHRFPIGTDGLRQVADNVWHLPRGFRWQWAGVRFLALGGAHSVDRPYRQPKVSWWKEETLSRADVARAQQGGPADVLVSHDCPAGVTIPGIDDRAGPAPFPPLEILRANEHRQLLRSALESVQPGVVWHGHYHVRYDAVVDLGWGPVAVHGLDCDGVALDANVRVVNLASLVRREAAA